jgi:long-chain acyl-CoA synthetase
MPANLAELLTRAAGRFGDRIALKLDDQEVNYAFLNEAASRVAGLLKAKGIEPGDRVGLMLPNVPYFPIAYYGILRAGAVVVPMNVLFKGREVGFILRDSGAKLLLAWHDFAEGAEQGAADVGVECVLVRPGDMSVGSTELTSSGGAGFAGAGAERSGGSTELTAGVGLTEPAQQRRRRLGRRRSGDACGGAGFAGAGAGFEQLLAGVEPYGEVAERDPSDTAVILYTSGTTGTPKGAELTHANLMRNADASIALFGFDQDTVVLGSLPLFHSFGQTCTLNAAMKAGAAVSLLPRFDAGKALEIIQRDRVNVFQGVPTMYGALLNQPERESYDTSSLRLAVSGGASLPVELLRGFEETFACKILEGYGLSETSPVASFNHPDKERKPGSIGTPIGGVEMKLVDGDRRDVAPGEVGEIAIRGHNVMKGYLGRPDATAEAISEDGWFHSGDLARMDEDGYFFIVDRKKDMIIRGGFNIYPRELEEVLYEHPAVREAAVVGIPHASLGEEVGAAVSLKPGLEATAEELRDFVKAQVAAYKYPRKIWFLDELPKTATGKILKREIELPVEEEAAPSAEGAAA